MSLKVFFWFLGEFFIKKPLDGQLCKRLSKQTRMSVYLQRGKEGKGKGYDENQEPFETSLGYINMGFWKRVF